MENSISFFCVFVLLPQVLLCGRGGWVDAFLDFVDMHVLGSGPGPGPMHLGALRDVEKC